MAFSGVHVGIDVGCENHQVAIGLSTGELLEEFQLSHQPSGLSKFFQRMEYYQHHYKQPILVAMEGYNGYARPLDRYILAKGYRLLNVNNNKLAQFKKVFSGPAKSDVIDARKMLELFTLAEHLPLAKGDLQEIKPIPEVNQKLKYLTRCRRNLIHEKIRLINHFQADLQAVCPGLLQITGSADNLWFLRFLTACQSLDSLVKLKCSDILAIKGIGASYRPGVYVEATFGQD